MALALSGIPVSLIPPFLFGIPLFLLGGGLAIAGLLDKKKSSSGEPSSSTPSIHSGLPLSDYDRGQLDSLETMQKQLMAAMMAAQAEAEAFVNLPIKQQIKAYIDSNAEMITLMKGGNVPIPPHPLGSPALMTSEENVNNLIEALESHNRLMSKFADKIPDQAKSLLDLDGQTFTLWTDALFEGLHSHCVPFENHMRFLIENFSVKGNIPNGELHRVLKAPIQTAEQRQEAQKAFSDMMIKAAQHGRAQRAKVSSTS